MASYDIAQYLLDRANIHDTIVKVPIYYDTADLPNLSGLYAPYVEIDYTAIIGGSPYTISRADWVERVGGLLEKYSATQHVTSGIIANLPQPTANATRPEKVTVQAQVAGHMVGVSESGSDGVVSLTQNGGLLEAELQRDTELENQGQNPWRITKYKVSKKWAKADTTRSS
ncbi:hypothetical protein C8A00DRAFT_39832 [Chaetomidium leptoderma]|uniref:SnoaL-like domain-containing protein n=1 Tax=Chaetomidium leptoderma TaxID=669021 RepID=A0AAN7A1B5_9PEZI|nr:hypothetical protein C8A00DRAFT_39832 [Chaetomidium leptoderma]